MTLTRANLRGDDEPVVALGIRTLNIMLHVYGPSPVAAMVPTASSRGVTKPTLDTPRSRPSLRAGRDRPRPEPSYFIPDAALQLQGKSPRTRRVTGFALGSQILSRQSFTRTASVDPTRVHEISCRFTSHMARRDTRPNPSLQVGDASPVTDSPAPHPDPVPGPNPVHSTPFAHTTHPSPRSGRNIIGLSESMPPSACQARPQAEERPNHMA